MAEETNSSKKIVVASRPPLPPSRVNNHQVCLTKHVPKLDFFQKAFLTDDSYEEEFGVTHPVTSCASPAAYSLSSMSSLSSDETDNISCGHSFLDERVTYISPQRKQKVSKCRSLVVKVRNRALFNVLKTLYFCLILSSFLLILPIFEERVNKSAPNLVNFGVTRKIVSLLDIVLLSSFQWFHNVVVESAQRTAVTFCFKNLMRKAIANPAKFILRFKQLLACIRYAKFLAPLIGQCNKLRGHASDLVKQWNQRLCILKAQTEWKFLMRRISVQQKTNRVYAKIMPKVHERRKKEKVSSHSKTERSLIKFI